MTPSSEDEEEKSEGSAKNKLKLLEFQATGNGTDSGHLYNGGASGDAMSESYNLNASANNHFRDFERVSTSSRIPPADKHRHSLFWIFVISQNS